MFIFEYSDNLRITDAITMNSYKPKARIPDCRLFSGYKPCLPYKTCEGCPDPQPVGKKILIINLDNIGAVLMTTAQLPAIKRAYPESTIFWLTQKMCLPVLENNPYLHEVFAWDDENRLILQAMSFDLILNADKNRNACAFLMQLKAREKRGFGLNANGATVPLNPGAEYNYRLGTHDYEKFRVNKRTGQEILAETWELPYARDPYVLELTAAEKAACERWRRELGLQNTGLVVGMNTGCSEQFPNKKLLVEQQAALARRIATELPECRVILLGGREDTVRNNEIASLAGEAVVQTPTTLGLRTGIVLENLANVVISGDSLGMHIAIGLKKYVIAWFGLSCAAEIDLYDRGVKLIRDLPCAPCWKKVCDLPHGPICVKEFDVDRIFEQVAAYYALRMVRGSIRVQSEVMV